MEFDLTLLLEWTIKSMILIFVLLTGFAYTTFYERRLLALIQVRIGPNRAGPFGFFQPVATIDENAGNMGILDLTPEEDADFRPHGLSLWRGEDGREHLFVLDHTGGEHSVRIYGIFDERLDLLATVTDPLLVAPNDLVAVGPDRFYVTNDHRHTEGLARTLEDWLQLPFASVLYWDGERMTEAAAGFPFANGINASPDGRTVYVASTLGREVRVYAREPQSGSLELRERISLGTGPDNIEVDEEGALWIGAHPKILQLSRYMAGREPHAPAQVLRLIQAGDAWQVEEIYLDTGEALSAASVGAFHEGRLLIGAVAGDRFLDCKMSAF